MNIYNETDGLKYVMEQRWNKNSDGEFPRIKKKLIENFQWLENFLNEKYHLNVNLGAAASGDGILTDHGKDHVQMVMEVAFKIINGKIHLLKGYEIFLLLVAIHFHDLGNISGRAEHEIKIIDIMNEMGDKIPLDDPEKEIVTLIATAHSGFVHGNHEDKDTLRTLDEETFCNGIQIRPAILASILRFADELSDDFSRSKDMNVPESNKIFHEYSKSLEPLGFKGKTLVFKYRIPYDKTKETLKNGSKEIYLYDEILERLSKCLRELDYCRKYADGFINITTLNVTIIIKDPENPIKKFDSDEFRLCLIGYPDESNFCLSKYVVNENPFYNSDNSFEKIQKPKYASGEYLKNAIIKRESEQYAE